MKRNEMDFSFKRSGAISNNEFKRDPVIKKISENFETFLIL